MSDKPSFQELLTPSITDLERENIRFAAEVLRLQNALEAEKISREMERGHTEHCARAIVFGGMPCECEAPPMTLNGWAEVIHQTAKDKGWWAEGKPRNFGEICALFHSEISEAFEEYRAGHSHTEVYENSDKPGKLEGVPVELADAIIRILDFCGWAGIDMQDVMARKHAYNQTRPYRHGNKIA